MRHCDRYSDVHHISFPSLSALSEQYVSLYRPHHRPRLKVMKNLITIDFFPSISHHGWFSRTNMVAGVEWEEAVDLGYTSSQQTSRTRCLFIHIWSVGSSLFHVLSCLHDLLLVCSVWSLFVCSCACLFIVLSAQQGNHFSHGMPLYAVSNLLAFPLLRIYVCWPGQNLVCIYKFPFQILLHQRNYNRLHFSTQL